MILAAGRGERMRPLTDSIPKPLLEVRGKPLIMHQIAALKQAGIEQLVINTGALGEQMHARLGNGNELGVEIAYSDEGDEPLETAGGIINALPLLGDGPFIVANADIYTNFDYACLPASLDSEAHLVLVPNPAHHPEGDFALENDRVHATGKEKFTYSGIGVYQTRMFENLAPGHRALAPLLIAAMENGAVTGVLHSGYWNDIGTPERLEQANAIKL